MMSQSPSTPSVSVLMTVYNGAQYLHESVQSILSQTYSDFEFIIINDGSTDQTESIVLGYHDERIIYVKNEQNAGLIASLNKGLLLAKGDLVARMDADDISLPTRLATEVSFLSEHPDVGVVGSYYQTINEWGALGGEAQRPESHHLIQWELCFQNPLAHPTIMMRKDVVQKVGGYSPDMLHAEDRDLWQRLTKVAKFYNIQKTLLLRRRHSDNITSRFKDIQIENDKKIASRMVQEILQKDVAIELVGKLNSKTLAKSDALAMVQLLINMYQIYRFKYNLSPEEQKILRKQVAIKVFNWSITWPSQMIKYLLWSCQVYPHNYRRLWWVINKKIFQRQSTLS